MSAPEPMLKWTVPSRARRDLWNVINSTGSWGRSRFERHFVKHIVNMVLSPELRPLLLDAISEAGPGDDEPREWLTRQIEWGRRLLDDEGGRGD